MALFISRTCIKLQTEQSRLFEKRYKLSLFSWYRNRYFIKATARHRVNYSSRQLKWLNQRIKRIIFTHNDQKQTLYSYCSIAKSIQCKLGIRKKIGFKLMSMYLLLLEFIYWTQHYKYTVIKRNSELSHSKPWHIKSMISNWFLEVLTTSTLYM